MSTNHTSRSFPAELGKHRALPESPEKLRLNKHVVLLRSYSPWQSAIDKTINLSLLNPYNFLLVLNSARIFIAYDLIWITWALIEVLFYKGNLYRLTETLFKFWRKRKCIYDNVLVYMVFERPNNGCVELTLYRT